MGFANLVMGSAPPERAGSAASLMETSAELGIALGVATLGSLGTLVFPGQYTTGLNAVAAVGMVIFVALAVVGAFVFRPAARTAAARQPEAA